MYYKKNIFKKLFEIKTKLLIKNTNYLDIHRFLTRGLQNCKFCINGGRNSHTEDKACCVSLETRGYTKLLDTGHAQLKLGKFG